MRYQNIHELILHSQRELFGWVPFKMYNAMFPSETREVIRSRLRRGVWQPGVHATRGGAYELWIHLRNVRAWLEQQETVEEPLPDPYEPQQPY